MAKKKYYVVWNAAKTEGFITDDKADALFTAEGIPMNFGNPTVGESFRECYADDDEVLPMQRITLEV